jgi:basic membrane protein A
MKKLLSMVLTLMMLVGLFAGCAKEAEAVTDGAATTEVATEATTEATTEEATEEVTEVETEYKVAMILDSTISDGGWGAACYNAMVEGAKRTNFETQYTDALNSADFASTMRSYCDLGFNLIFAPGNQYSDAVKEVAAEYPDVDFALLNGTVEAENIVSLLPDAKQIGYMAGALAGLMSKTNSIGFVGGMELDTTKMKLASFEAAAKAVNPDIMVYSAYAGSFSDTAKGKEIADSMISLYDVDVMFGDASAVDSGVREVLANYEGKYDIGQPSDLLATQESSVIISSVVTDNATMIELCMNDVKNDTFGNKTIYGDLANGALSIGTFSDLVPEEMRAEYMTIAKSIAEGSFITE